MSRTEIKRKIIEKMNGLNEEQLKIILKIIEETYDENQEELKSGADLFFSEALSKYGNALKKLAQ